MDQPAEVYTPDRIRSMAALVYRLSAGNAHVREVGNYLASCAAAADQNGDLLQQRNHLRAELGRLQGAVAEADAARLEVARLKADLLQTLQALSAARQVAAMDRAAREHAEGEMRGQRLWLELARAMVEEARQLLPADKAALLDPMRAARVAASDRGLLAEAGLMLRRLARWASLAAQNAGNEAAKADVAAAEALLERPEWPTKS
jgi:hypothetical protein